MYSLSMHMNQRKKEKRSSELFCAIREIHPLLCSAFSTSQFASHDTSVCCFVSAVFALALATHIKRLIWCCRDHHKRFNIIAQWHTCDLANQLQKKISSADFRTFDAFKKGWLHLWQQDWTYYKKILQARAKFICVPVMFEDLIYDMIDMPPNSVLLESTCP